MTPRKSLSDMAETALAWPVLLGIEPLRPKYAGMQDGYILTLTIDRGYYPLEQNFGGPVWHAGVRLTVPPARKEYMALRRHAYDALKGLGTREKGEWTERNWVQKRQYFHVRRRLSDSEEAKLADMLADIVGPTAPASIADLCADIRGTEPHVQLAHLIAQETGIAAETLYAVDTVTLPTEREPDNATR